MKFLEIIGISKQQQGQQVLHNIGFAQEKGQRLAIAGESGAGKSTLLKIIAGLVQPDAGEVLFENKRVEGPNEKLIAGHPLIAYLSQHFELRNNYRVEEILEYASTLSRKESESLYEICHISHLLHRTTDQLSGGEKQRIALARLLTTSPRLLLLDEPFSNLDMRHRNVLRSVIERISEKLTITCLLVSHDPQDFLPWADHILIMKDGKLLQQGAPELVYRQPVNAYAAGLLGKYNVFLASQVSGIEPKGKYLFVRPENMKLVTAQPHAMPGTVTKILFAGNAWEIEVLVEYDTVTIRTEQVNVSIGDKVHVAIDKQAAWFWN